MKIVYMAEHSESCGRALLSIIFAHSILIVCEAAAN